MSNTHDKIEQSTHKEAAAMALALHMELRKLQAENRELWRMLEKCEKAGYEHIFKCPRCNWSEGEGYSPRIKLSALLKRKPKDL